MQALESNKKWIRNYAQFKARKTSPEDQCTYIMARLLERSDPYQLELKKKYHKQSTKRAAPLCPHADVNQVIYELDRLGEELLI